MRNRIRIALGFTAGVLDGLGCIRARDWLTDRIEWSGRAIDAFDLAADWFIGDR